MPANNTSERIDRLFGKEKWVDARRLIEQELVKLPADDWMRHWWLTRLSTTYYEERNYTKAREFVKQAAAIAPHCPLVLWDLAGTLDMLGDTDGAIQVYRRLIGLGVGAIASDECGEGVKWAKGVVADCWYRLAACYDDKRDDVAAYHNLEQFRRELARGAAGIYTTSDAEKLAGTLRDRLIAKSSYGANTSITAFSLEPFRGAPHLAPALPKCEEASSYTPDFLMALVVERYTSTSQAPRKPTAS